MLTEENPEGVQQRVTTSNELLANFELAGAVPDEVCAELGLTSAKLAEVLTVAPEARALDVWRLRDHLEAAIRAAGDEPFPYSWLTDHLRPGVET